MISDDQLVGLIQGGESERVEFTTSVSDLDKIREAICAFANNLPNHDSPGIMFIGINDDGSCANLDIDDILLQKLAGLRDDGTILPFPSMQVDKRKLQGCEVAVIQVESSENPPVKVRNRCCIRVGSRRGYATSEDEQRLTEKRRWGQLSYDMHEVKEASIEDDIDVEKFTHRYLPNAVSPEVLEENARDPIEQMQSLRLLTREHIPTVTAILMLGRDTRYWFPCAYIQFVRYDGNEVTEPIKSHKEINGTLPDQLHELDNILETNISTALDTSGRTHSEQSDYPYNALRELVRNAVIHRNYESSHTPVRINWFADSIVISSPGGVYGTVTKKNFGGGVTSYRNPTIAEAMKNMGFMQRFGFGIATARKLLKDNGNPEAEFDIEENFIFVTVRKRT